MMLCEDCAKRRLTAKAMNSYFCFTAELEKCQDCGKTKWSRWTHPDILVFGSKPKRKAAITQ